MPGGRVPGNRRCLEDRAARGLAESRMIDLRRSSKLVLLRSVLMPGGRVPGSRKCLKNRAARSLTRPGSKYPEGILEVAWGRNSPSHAVGRDFLRQNV